MLTSCTFLNWISFSYNSYCHCHCHSTLLVWNWTVLNKVKVKVTLRLTVRRPVCPHVKHLSGAYEQMFIKKKLNSMVLVRKRTIPSEWPQPAGEVSLEKRDYGRGDPSRWPRDTLYQLKLAQMFITVRYLWVCWCGALFLMREQVYHCKSQSYFTTGSLPPISLSWCQAPWDPRQEIYLVSNWTLAVLVLT
jgi:hypothetical protein